MHKGGLIVGSSLHYKGGVGKSTSILQLAGALSMRGLRVLAVDLDPQGNLTQCLLSSGQFDAFADEQTVTALFGNSEPSASHMIHQTPIANIRLLPASRGLAAFNHTNPAKHGWLETSLDQFLPEVGADFDAVLIDTPPTLQLLTWAALTASRFAYTPIIPEPPSVQGILDVRQFIAQVRETRNPSLRWLGLLMNRVKPSLAIHRLYSAELVTLYPEDLFASFLPDAAVFPEAMGAGVPITQYKPKCAAAKAALGVLEEMARRGGWELPPIPVPVKKPRQRKAA